MLKIGAKSAIIKADGFAIGVIAHFTQRRRGLTAAPARAFSSAFLGNQRDGAVEADLEQLVDVRHVGVGLEVFHVGAVAAEVGHDRLAVFRVLADFARQREQLQRLFEVEVWHRPAVGDRRAAGLVGFLDGVCAKLHIGAEAAVLEKDGHAFRVIAEHLAFRRDVAVARLFCAERACEAAFGIVRAADEGAELAELQRELAGAARRALARIELVAGFVQLGREDVRLENFVERVDDVGDA